MNRWTAAEGSPRPLGITFVEPEQAYNFALYSKHATEVTVHLYTEHDPANPLYSYRFDYLKNKSGRIWHCRIPADLVDQASHYGYQVDGPVAHREGHRFDHDKILLDPYARAVYFPPGFNRMSAIGPGPNRGVALLGIIQANHVPFDWCGDHRPRHSHDTVIYELHVKGFTTFRGTVAGKVMIKCQTV